MTKKNETDYNFIDEGNVKNTGRNKKTEKKKKNPQIMIIAAAFTGLFLCLIVYIVQYALSNQQELMNNSYNGRQQMLLSQNRRGTIYSADGDILAITTVQTDDTETREYPYGGLFAHAVGYSVNGRMGVESQANYYLIHSNAPLSVKAAAEDADDKFPGDDVYTTLDVQLQQIASTALGVYKGAILVTEPSTGKILAMVSKPDFDPNTIASEWDTLREDATSSVLLNRTTQGLYPPGSTFKMITALEYIRENPDTYQNYSFNCTGSITRGEDRIQCYHGSVHGQVDFTRSFAKSCNSSFANIGLSLDRSAFSDTLNGLLFNQDLPLSLTYNKSSVGMDADTSDSDTMQVSIGQGSVSMTPIHLNMITSAIANQGTLMEPYLIDCVKNSEGTIVKSFEPTEYGQLLTEKEASILTDLMTDVVEEGTATRLSGLSYTAAGKTGSAEYGTVKGDSHAWFTGFAPAEDPEICVTIIIEGAGSGGDYAVPIAKRIFDGYFGAE